MAFSSRSTAVASRPPPDQGIEREAAGVRAEIEHGAVGAEGGQVAAVVALIAEKAGLVAALEAHPEAEAVLADHDLIGGLARRHGTPREVLGQRDRFVHLCADVGRSQALREQPADRPETLVDAQAERLDREHVGEAIDDQAGQAVALGVNDAEGVGRRVEPEHVAPQADRLVEPGRPERRTGRLGLPAQEPHRDLRLDIPEPEAERDLVAVHNPHQVAAARRGPPIGPMTILR